MKVLQIQKERIVLALLRFEDRWQRVIQLLRHVLLTCEELSVLQT